MPNYQKKEGTSLPCFVSGYIYEVIKYGVLYTRLTKLISSAISDSDAFNLRQRATYFSSCI